ISRRPAPYNPRPGRLVCWLTNLGAVSMAGAIWIGAQAQAGAVLVAAGVFMLAYMLAYRWIPPAMTKILVFEWRRRIS
ncbi:MAG TPA: hypothetical protein VFJ24_05545, partial [Gaiellales bacterium]|nr:hypothetical protein [Gaiellales bacterium]